MLLTLLADMWWIVLALVLICIVEVRASSYFERWNGRLLILRLIASAARLTIRVKTESTSSPSVSRPPLTNLTKPWH